MAIRGDVAGIEKQFLLDMLPLEGGRVLEIGCGDGRLTWQYAELADRVVGIDVTRGSLTEGIEARPEGLRESVDIVLASSVELPFATDSFHHALFAWSF